MITQQKAIEALQKRIDAISRISSIAEFNNWKKTTGATLLNFYDEKDVRVVGLVSIKAYIPNEYVSGGTERLSAAKNDAQSYLEGLIEDIGSLGLQSKAIKGVSNNGVSVNVNQHNNQKQVTHININLEFLIDAIKDELKGGQVKELKAVLEGNEEPEQKKKSFTEKIKSFGSDVASNILANVLTNPQVYEKIGRMF